MFRIFLYRDREGVSRIWQDNFRKTADALGISVISIPFENLFGHPRKKNVILKKIRKHYRKGDFFIARFNERKEHLIAPIYPELLEIFGENYIFPDSIAQNLYNNKKRQVAFFNRTGYPAPSQKWVVDGDGLKSFLQTHSLSFPIVKKKSHGAGATNVSLLYSYDTNYLFVAQEYCRNNKCDYRIIVVGDKIFGFLRKNRENDFRASGSGLLEYVDDLPMGCVKLAHAISSEQGFISMAYDFIRNNASHWVIVEISYTFGRSGSKCQYYYSAKDNFKKIKKPVGSVERLILEYLMNR